MGSKKFIRNRENFRCEHCEVYVFGDGYTNHCPSCLYSKHVDVYPGDRASDCGGLMKPIGLRVKNGKQQIIHKCLRCGHIHPTKIVPDDNKEVVLALTEIPLPERFSVPLRERNKVTRAKGCRSRGVCTPDKV